MSGQVFAVLYADQGAERGDRLRESWPATLEVLSRHAARVARSRHRVPARAGRIGAREGAWRSAARWGSRWESANVKVEVTLGMGRSV